MIIRKTPREVELMREAGRIVALAHHEVKKYVIPGVSLKELDAIVEKVIRENGAIPSFKGYGGFPASACISVNEVVVHGIPGKQTLADGDIVSIDIGALFKGYHGDSAWTYAVGEVNPERKKLMEVTEEALFKGLEQVYPGNKLSNVSYAIQQHAEANGFSIVREFTGHGIGQNLHEDPAIPNFGTPNKGPVLKAGMVLAIEPIINVGKPAVKILSDQWTAVSIDGSTSAHYEHTVAVTDDGYKILTTL
ncbi:MAG: type I methionyl aminopeptidase [Culicoidibacterales bacterium]